MTGFSAREFSERDQPDPPLRALMGPIERDPFEPVPELIAPEPRIEPSNKMQKSKESVCSWIKGCHSRPTGIEPCAPLARSGRAIRRTCAKQRS